METPSRNRIRDDDSPSGSPRRSRSVPGSSRSVKRRRIDTSEDNTVVTSSPRSASRLMQPTPSQQLLGEIDETTPSDLLRQLSRSLDPARTVLTTPKRPPPSRNASTAKRTPAKGRGAQTPRQTPKQTPRMVAAIHESAVRRSGKNTTVISRQVRNQEDDPMDLLRALSRAPGVVEEGRQRLRRTIEDREVPIQDNEADMSNTSMDLDAQARDARRNSRRSTLGSIGDNIMGDIGDLPTPTSTRGRRSTIGSVNFDADDIARYADTSALRNAAAFFPLSASDLGNVGSDSDEDNELLAPPSPDEIAAGQMPQDDDALGFYMMGNDSGNDQDEALESLAPTPKKSQPRQLRTSVLGGRTRKKQAEKLSAAGIPVPALPSALVKNIFGTFAKSKVSKDVLNAVMEGSFSFFEQVSEDLAAYAGHAGRKTIDETDMLTLMKRQRQVSSRQTINSLAQRFLPRELSDEVDSDPKVKKRSKRAAE